MVIRWTLAAVLAALGLWLVFRGLRRAVFRNPELGWPAVDGSITESFVEERDQGEGKSYDAHVEYTYLLDGVSYLGTRIAPLGSVFGLRWTAQSERRPYTAGQAVKVFVNPRNPGEAVLEPHQQTSRALTLAVLGLLACAAAWWFAFERRTTN